MKLKNKILIILIALILFITLNSINSFAATEHYSPITKTDIPTSIKYYNYIYDYLPEGEFNILLFETDNKAYLLTYSHETYTRFNLEYATSSSPNAFRSEGNMGVNYHIFDITDNTLTLNSSKSGAVSISSIENINFIYTNSALFEHWNETNVIFEHQNNNSNTEKTTILDKTINSKDLDGVFSQILSILPVLLIVLVGFIALRKGINFIQNIMHNS